jgi:hypothetical protein
MERFEGVYSEELYNHINMYMMGEINALELLEEINSSLEIIAEDIADNTCDCDL